MNAPADDRAGASRPGQGTRSARDHVQVGLPLVELRCGAVAAGGGCVARGDDGRVVFVRHALPGEHVLAQVTHATTSYQRADAVEILEPSPDRVQPPCAHAGPGRCGGCDWQHVTLPAQRRLKGELVAEQLRRLAGVLRPVEVEEVPGASDGLGWRTRVRFAVDGEGRVGLRRHRSHEIEPVERCGIAAPSVAAIGAERLRWPGAREVEVFAPEPEPCPTGALAGSGPGVVVVSPGPRGVRPSELPRIATPEIGVVVERQVVRSPSRVRAVVLGRPYRISAGAFWQVHRGAPTMLASAVLEGLAPRAGERTLDLFAGVGLFSVLLAEAVGPTGSVVAVERDRRACADARHNARDHPQVAVRAARVTPELVTELGSVDLVVLDPPREGAGRALVAALVGLRPAPRRVAYVACDPASFARDLKFALDAGWAMPCLRAFDQFPMTEHVELVAILEPARQTDARR